MSCPNLKAAQTISITSLLLASIVYTKNTAIDPETKIETPLFNPRSDRWQDHFVWSNDKLRLLGTTPTGRATVNALDCNRDRLISIRIADIAINRHPPIGDL